jgi:hypothetical protein
MVALRIMFLTMVLKYHIKKNCLDSKKMKGRRKKQAFSRSRHQRVGTRKGGMRVYMMDVFCIHT